MLTVKVSLGDRSYDIRTGSGVLKDLGAHCKALALGNRCAIITDTEVEKFYAETAVRSLTAAGFEPFVIAIKNGERSKNLKVVQECYEKLAAERFERKSFVIALGGGVVGDLAGFVAASYLRGLPFVQVPTTLLAQVDSSVGGKVGVNLKAGKNLVGAFYQPRLVLCDLETFSTLPDREFRAGLAEVIKYGIIYDAQLFQILELEMPAILRRDPQLLGRIVTRSCEIKAEVVAQDEMETGLRAILNFGHTIGHALEAISGYGKYLHGEAISIGQIAAAKLSNSLIGLPGEDVERIRRLFMDAGLPQKVKLSPVQKEKLFEAMKLDKKVSAGEIKFVLATKIGQVEYGIKVPEEEVRRVLA